MDSGSWEIKPAPLREISLRWTSTGVESRRLRLIGCSSAVARTTNRQNWRWFLSLLIGSRRSLRRLSSSRSNCRSWAAIAGSLESGGRLALYRGPRRGSALTRSCRLRGICQCPGGFKGPKGVSPPPSGPTRTLAAQQKPLPEQGLTASWRQVGSSGLDLGNRVGVECGVVVQEQEPIQVVPG